MTTLTVQTLTIEDCETTIYRAYYAWGRGNADDSPEPDWENATDEQRRGISQRGYSLYDGWPNFPDDEIGPTECYVSTGINSRVILNDVIRLIIRAEVARPFLEAIPNDARLEDATPAQLAAGAELIDRLIGADYVSWGKATKVLYKKRPGFIPILDFVVTDFLWKNFPHRPKRGIRGVLDLYREILLRRAGLLSTVQANIAADFDLSTSRILNFLIWEGWYGSTIPTTRTIPQVWDARGLADARAAAAAAWP